MPLSTFALALLALGACSPAPDAGAAAERRADGRRVEASAPDPFSDAPTALDSVDRAWVQRTMASLSLRQKVGQMVLAWSSGRWDGAGSDEMRRLLRNVATDQVAGSSSPPARRSRTRRS